MSGIPQETKIGNGESLTPIGDWLRNRYPPNDGATHWLGRNGDPGCCAGDHPMCLYEVAFREGQRVQREASAHLAEQSGVSAFIVRKLRRGQEGGTDGG